MNKQFKEVIKALPFSSSLIDYLRKKQSYFSLRNQSAQDIFTEIHSKRGWGSSYESLSGSGSSLEQTEVIRSFLLSLFQTLNIRSILDIPCGDFNWIQMLDLNGISYIGADIVPGIIQDNQKYASETVGFKELDIIQDPLPKVDIVFVRDCLVHFSDDDVIKSIQNICKSDSKYLLTTTFQKKQKNTSIITGQWRGINLEKPPFSFPAPLKIINEQHPEPEWADKSMGLWELDTLKKLFKS